MTDKRKHHLQIIAKHLKELLKDHPKTKGTLTDFSPILDSYRLFVDQMLEHYLHDYREEERHEIKRDFYKLFWKTFFDEVANEANQVYELHKEKLAERERFWDALQVLAYDGLKRLKEGTI